VTNVRKELLKWLGRILGDEEIGAQEEEGFRAHAAQANLKAGYFTAVMALVASVGFWPSDFLFFADRPEMIAAFA